MTVQRVDIWRIRVPSKKEVLCVRADPIYSGQSFILNSSNQAHQTCIWAFIKVGTTCKYANINHQFEDAESKGDLLSGSSWVYNAQLLVADHECTDQYEAFKTDTIIKWTKQSSLVHKISQMMTV